ncbi:MAG: thiamine diphosphokinase [Lachnospiraceae bacterium]|nr:thiamine diphosphokinase [Lachnospiraceae bacterium]
MADKICLIISGGEYNPLPKGLRYDHVIACDKGIIYSEKMNIVPDVIIGDFDSTDESVVSDYILTHSFDQNRVLKFPSHKDDSDTMLAIREALKKGYSHLEIVCALGGRLDHTLANIQSMAYAAEQGASLCRISGKRDILTVIKDSSLILEKKEGYSLSVFSLSDRCLNVNIRGSAYDAEGITLTGTFPLGLSNEYVSDRVSVSVETGILLIVESSYL